MKIQLSLGDKLRAKNNPSFELIVTGVTEKEILLSFSAPRSIVEQEFEFFVEAFDFEPARWISISYDSPYTPTH